MTSTRKPRNRIVIPLDIETRCPHNVPHDGPVTRRCETCRSRKEICSFPTARRKGGIVRLEECRACRDSRLEEVAEQEILDSDA